MAKAPATPRPSRRKRSSTRTGKSLGGKIASVVVGAAAVTGVGAGLVSPSFEASAVCGGERRWPVKVANDPDASQINLTSDRVYEVPDIVKAMLPGLMPTVGRMQVEKQAYTVHGYLSYFKEEDDRDYHVVIADKPGDYSRGLTTPNGRSLVVEFPDPHCFPGTKKDTHPSVLKDQVTEARDEFEKHVKDLQEEKTIATPMPVTVTGIGFFDEDHGHQVGRSTPQTVTNRKGKYVFELHPVVEISFDNDPDVD